MTRTETARPARSVPAYDGADADEYLRPGNDDVIELDHGWLHIGEGCRMRSRAKGCQ